MKKYQFVEGTKQEVETKMNEMSAKGGGFAKSESVTLTVPR